jgi:monoamine oxidase
LIYKILKKFFWEEGTHFYKPLPKEYKNRKDFIKVAQHPQDNIWVIGEVVSLKQGWVNGALESVQNISFFASIKF